MSTLTDFLLARIAEDEAGAVRQLSEATTQRPQGSSAREIGPDAAGSPTRVLAECDAKRRWIDWVEHESTSDLTAEQRVSLRYMALPYATHPEYRDEWRP